MPQPSTGISIIHLDSLRGLLALWVATTHSWQWLRPVTQPLVDYLPLVARGTHAVPMFCMLSAMLIYRSLQRELSTEALRQYFVRRFLRIYPLYLLTVILTWIVAADFYSSSIDDRGGGLLFFLSRAIADLAMTKSIGYGHIFNGPAWSLYVEVLFYFLMPVYLLMFRRQIVVASIIAYSAFVLIGYVFGDQIGLFKYFALGVLLGEWSLRPPAFLARVPNSLLVVVGGILIAVDVSVEFRQMAITWLGTMLPHPIGDVATRLATGISHLITYTGPKGVGFLMMLIAIGRSERLARPLRIAPLRFLGIISYSVFLLHGFILTADVAFRPLAHKINQIVVPQIEPTIWLVPVVLIPAIVFWATISFLLVERTFLRLRPRKRSPGAGDRLDKVLESAVQ
jgi:peptidoglycan/LPS O-acetylase OafA/YrhL